MLGKSKKKYLIFAGIPLFFLASPVAMIPLFYNFVIWYLFPWQLILDLLALWQNPLAWSMLWFTLFFPGGELGLYLGVLLVSIIGNVTVIFPVPYVIFLWFLVLFRPWTNMLLLGIFAGGGAAIGETSAWLIGRGGQELIEDSSYGKRLVRYGDLIERGWGIPLIILFAATPLPDDVLLLTLGLTDYSLVKAISASFVGKIIMCTLIAYGAQFLSNVEFFGKTILEWFSGEAGLTTMIIGIAIMGIIVLALIFIDWEKLCGRIRGFRKPKKIEPEERI
ncbi:MAG: VTT domain-containing protein [Candidatus Lokiarchaeia archaeon]